MNLNQLLFELKCNPEVGIRPIALIIFPLIQTCLKNSTEKTNSIGWKNMVLRTITESIIIKMMDWESDTDQNLFSKLSQSIWRELEQFEIQRPSIGRYFKYYER